MQQTHISKLVKTAGEINGWFLDLIFPKFCFGCNVEGYYLCKNCSATLKIYHFPFCPICKNGTIGLAKCPKHKSYATFCLSPFSYNNNLIKNLIHKYKYEFVKDIGAELADFMIDSIKYSGLFSFSAFQFDNFLIVPVPLHRRRLTWRGFNQSEIIAKKIAEEFKIDFSNKNLVRILNTSPQIQMQDAKQREENIKNAFTCKNPKEIKNKIIILIDDIITTGATLEECARVLKKNGAKEVWAMTIAK